MDKEKWTEGEWTTKPSNGGGRLLIRSGCIQKSLQVVPSEDACLMAASKDLYYALEDCIRFIQNDAPHRGGPEIAQGLTAMAKARGEQ